MMTSKRLGGVLIVVALGLFFAIGLSFYSSPKKIELATGLERYQSAGVPDFTIDSEGLKLSDLRGRLVIVNFWASWCEPCKVEMPSLVELARRFGDSGRVEILALSEDSNSSDFRHFVTDVAGVPPKNFRVFLDRGGAVRKEYGTEKLPESFLVDGNGKLVRKIIGEQNWIAPEFLKFFEGILERNK